MASTSFHLSLHPLHLRRVRNAPPISCAAHPPKPAPPFRTAALPGRRRWLLSLAAAATAMKAAEIPSMAQDIPLFGLRKKLKKVEEEAEVVIKEGIETAEKGVETAEKGIETAEREVQSAVSFGGLAQAAAVAAAEAVAVLAATSIVNGILEPQGMTHMERYYISIFSPEVTAVYGHCGSKGYGRVVWNVRKYHNESPSTYITFGYASYDLEEGFPRDLHASVTYTLSGLILAVEMRANDIDKATLVNLAHQSYWNLGGHYSGDNLSNEMQRPLKPHPHWQTKVRKRHTG